MKRRSVPPRPKPRATERTQQRPQARIKIGGKSYQVHSEGLIRPGICCTSQLSSTATLEQTRCSTCAGLLLCSLYLRYQHSQKKARLVRACCGSRRRCAGRAIERIDSPRVICALSECCNGRARPWRHEYRMPLLPQFVLQDAFCRLPAHPARRSAGPSGRQAVINAATSAAPRAPR